MSNDLQTIADDLQILADAQNSISSYFSTTSILTVLAIVMIPILGVVWATFGLNMGVWFMIASIVMASCSISFSVYRVRTIPGETLRELDNRRKKKH